MRNYENEQYAFLAHYGIPGMKRPRGLRYKTKNHAGGPASSFIGKRKPTKFITNATSHLNSDVSSDVTEFYKNKAKGESNNSLRLKRIAQVRATEAMAPVAAAQKKLFKKKKELPVNQKAIKLLKIKNAINNNYKNKKNAFFRDNVVKPAISANTPESQAAHVVRKSTKKAAEKTTNPFAPGSMRTSMETMIKNAKAKHPTAVATRTAYAGTWNALYNAPGSPKKAANNVRQSVKKGVKSTGSNFISDTKKSMEKQLEKAKRTNRSTYTSPSTTTKTTYVAYTPRDKNTNAPRPGHTDEKIMSAKDTTVKSKLYKKQKKK